MKTRVAFALLVILTAGLSVAQGQHRRQADRSFELGEEARNADKPAEALLHFDECLRLDPENWDAYAARASVKESLNDLKGALTDYSIYVEARPDDSEVLLSRAVLRYGLGQFKPARDDFQRLLTMPKGFTNKIFFRMDNAGEASDKAFTLQGESHANLFNYLGLIDTKLMNYKDAGIYLDSAQRLEPTEPQYIVNHGILLEHLIDTTGALADYQRALKVEPDFALAMHNIAVIKRSRGEQISSEKLLNEAIARTPSLPYPYAARAYYRFHHNNLSGALEDYNRVLTLNKSDEESWLYLGMVREKLRNYDDAFRAYTEAITLKEDFARAWVARGTLLTKMNHLPEAIEDYGVAILWYPDYGVAIYNRALAYLKSGLLKQACDDFNHAELVYIKVDTALKDSACKDK